MTNNRINTIISLINNQKAMVADIGSDHAFLAIGLLKQNRVAHVYNVEINKLPLQNTITNLKRHYLIDKTTNVINDGLRDWNLIKHFDYVTISGMGGKNILSILKNVPNTLKVDRYIVVPNNNAEDIRQFIKDNNYSIINEIIIDENNYYYELIEFATNPNEGIQCMNDNDVYFGPINLKNNTKEFKQKNINRYEYIKNNNLDKYNKQIGIESKLLYEWIKNNN